MRNGLSPLCGSAATEAVTRTLATPPRNVRRWISALGLTRARASGVTDDQVGHRHSGPKPPGELVRVELDADRIALEHHRVAFWNTTCDNLVGGMACPPSGKRYLVVAPLSLW